jgi:hypothetical protein
LKVAFDEHIPPALARALRALDLEGFEFHSAREFTTEARAPTDVPWIAAFAADGGEIVVSGERQMRSLPEVQAAIAETGVKSFYLPPRWNNWDMPRRVAYVLAWWDRIVSKAKESQPGDAWMVPTGWEHGEFKRVKVEERL